MKILVTGGSGFLGARLIPKLVDDGHQVFALARSKSSTDTVRSLGATPVQGDLDSPEELALPAVDAVVHAAALFRFAGPRAPYFRANVVGTQALLKAARRAGAATFVYISAAALVMDDSGTPLRNVDEAAPTHPESFSGYIASKSQGEAAVLAANQPGFRTIALRPPALWAPEVLSASNSPRPSSPANSHSSRAARTKRPQSTSTTLSRRCSAHWNAAVAGARTSSTIVNLSLSASLWPAMPKRKVSRSTACVHSRTESRLASGGSWKPFGQCAPTRAIRR